MASTSLESLARPAFHTFGDPAQLGGAGARVTMDQESRSADGDGETRRKRRMWVKSACDASGTSGHLAVTGVLFFTPLAWTVSQLGRFRSLDGFAAWIAARVRSLDRSLDGLVCTSRRAR